MQTVSGNSGMIPPPTPEINFFDTSLYVNRELSWIDFNQRVLEEALSPDAHPLLERVKFISIFSSNLDEYFMIRVAGIEDQYEAGIQDRTIDGYTPSEQLEKIRKMVLQQLTERHDCFYNDLLPAMQKEGIEFQRVSELSAAKQRALSHFFRKEAVTEHQDGSRCIVIDNAKKGNRVTITGNRQQKKEQVQSAEQRHRQRSAQLVPIMNIAIFHIVPAPIRPETSRFLCFPHITDGNADKNDQQNKSAKNPIRGTETKHCQLLLNASAASASKPIS